MAQCNGQIAAGDERLRAGDLAGAEQCYRSALDADPRSANAMQSIGFVCAQRGDHQAALTWAQRAVEAGLVFAAAASRYALGVARLMEHRQDDAIAALDEAVRLLPTDPGSAGGACFCTVLRVWRSAGMKVKGYARRPSRFSNHRHQPEVTSCPYC